jgi:hypothetical protein
MWSASWAGRGFLYACQGPWKIYGNPGRACCSLKPIANADAMSANWFPALTYERLRTRQADPGFANLPERASFSRFN